MKIKNPIGITNIGDPFILRVEDTFYLYATTFNGHKEGSIDGFNAWQSNDLVNWTSIGQVYQASDDSFGYKDFWAPEVVFHNGKYIMHYSARMKVNNSLRIGVAVADNPKGPFIDVYAKQPMFDFGYAVIDGHVFIDSDNKKYFYYDRDCSENIFEGRNESHIYVAQLDDTLTEIISKPKLVLKPSQSWETITGNWRWNEGPFIYKKENLYYMFYSAGFFASPTYAIGIATAKNPEGPFIKHEKNPILTSIDKKISGPGHNSLFIGLKDKLMVAYHGHTDMKIPSENRQLFISPISIEDGNVSIKLYLKTKVNKKI